MQNSVGFVIGEVEEREFKFLVDKEKEVERGTYVKVKHEIYGWVLAQVVDLRRYSESFSIKSIKSGERREFGNGKEHSIATAKVIGYLDEKKRLDIPKIPFKPGKEVYIADSALISKSLGMGNKSTGAYIGLLENDRNTKVYLDINKLLQKHVCVLAKTGAGKSYTIGVLIEELAEKGISTVIIDPHGEYSAMKIPNSNKKEIELMEGFEIKPKGYDNIVEFSPYLNINPEADRRFVIDITKISARELSEALPTRLPPSQKALIMEAIKTARSYGSYTIDDIINLINQSDSKAKWNIIANLEALKETRIFDGMPTKVEELVKPGTVSIINLKGAQPEVQQLIVMHVAKELFEARKRGMLNPFLLLIEEAHNFCPERGIATAISSKILRNIASEGRKFGIGLCVVSQRPARIDKNVLSQCNTQIILKITNPNDLRAISQSIEGFTPELEEEIKNLQPGVALIVGEVVEQPIIVRVRVKKSQHGGAAVEILKEKQIKKSFLDRIKAKEKEKESEERKKESKIKSLIQRLFLKE